MKKSNLTLFRKIFIFYSLFVSILILVLIVSFSMFASSLLTKNSFSSMNQSVKRISQQIDTLIENMDNTSNIILYNRDLLSILIDSQDYLVNNVNYFDVNPDQRKKANDILLSVLGTKSIPRRICIFNGIKNYISLYTVPTNSYQVDFNLQNLPWLDIINQKDAYSLVLPPHKDTWTDECSSVYVVSFLRKIISTLDNKDILGYIEIQQPYSMIENICNSSLSRNTKIYIKTDKGELIYPVKTPESAYSEYYFNKSAELTAANTSIVKNPKTSQAELMYSIVSPGTKWTFLQVMPNKDFMASIYRFQQIIILIGTLLVIGSLVIMFFLTNSLTSPIRQLRKSLEDVSLQNPSLDINLKENNNEILLFQSAFNKTLIRFHESMNQTIEARSKEVEAHFLALQAQMDPHFLYNSLMGISAVGQEYNNPKVVEMCIKLSRMLRYVASNNASLVNMSEEINYAENYISMMKYRHETNLEYDFVFDARMEEIKVPKLIIQPLIENSFSHGFKNIEPPYKISVKGTLADNSWTICVSDNGLGFHKDALDNINSKFEEYCKNIQVDKLEVGGMALFNIYVRFKILYGDYAVFNILNLDDTGAFVTIGGKVF